jgi:DMSO/TMAO reductase YedYZ molybdopterin-dependent catalytic subunit
MKTYKSILLLALLLISTLPLLTQAQTTKLNSLSVTGEVKTSLALTAKDLDKMVEMELNATDHDEKQHNYSGVELATILKLAGVTIGAELRGKNVAKFLLISATDGYRVVFSLAEADPEFSQKKILLATRKDGSLLPRSEGPFKIIIEGEKKKARFIRQINSIQIKYAQ